MITLHVCSFCVLPQEPGLHSQRPLCHLKPLCSNEKSRAQADHDDNQWSSKTALELGPSPFQSQQLFEMQAAWLHDSRVRAPCVSIALSYVYVFAFYIPISVCLLCVCLLRHATMQNGFWLVMVGVVDGPMIYAIFITQGSSVLDICLSCNYTIGRSTTLSGYWSLHVGSTEVSSSPMRLLVHENHLRVYCDGRSGLKASCISPVPACMHA